MHVACRQTTPIPLDVNIFFHFGTVPISCATDPSKILDRAELPFIKPELPWETSGQYAAGTTFVEGQVLFKNQWLLYYGCADTFVGVATAPVRTDQLKTP